MTFRVKVMPKDDVMIKDFLIFTTIILVQVIDFGILSSDHRAFFEAEIIKFEHTQSL